MLSFICKIYEKAFKCYTLINLRIQKKYYKVCLYYKENIRNLKNKIVVNNKITITNHKINKIE